MKIKLTTPISAKEIERITKCIACTAENAEIRYIATHSSEVEKDTLFLSMAGEHANGEDFREEVLSRGGYLLTEAYGDKSFTVASVNDALFALAKAHLEKLTKRKHTVAITGSVGKTTTKEMLRLFLSDRFLTHATEGNKNSEIGLPLTILSAPTDTEILILEMGMNHAGEIARLSLLAVPDTVIITNIGHAHIGNLGSRAAIAKAKKEILIGAPKNADVFIPSGEPLLSDISRAQKIGLFNKEGTYALVRNEDCGGGHLLLYQGEKTLCIPEKLQDKGMLSAFAFAAVTAMHLGITAPEINGKIIDFEYNIFRQKIHFCRGMKIIYDAYNASYESVLCAIESLKSTPAPMHALLLGDMRELGSHAESLHRALGSACAKAREVIDMLFLFGEHASLIADQAEKEGFDRQSILVNTDETRPQITAEQILDRARAGMLLWIKGARGMRMERILHILKSDVGGDDDAG